MRDNHIPHLLVMQLTYYSLRKLFCLCLFKINSDESKITQQHYQKHIHKERKELIHKLDKWEVPELTL